MARGDPRRQPKPDTTPAENTALGKDAEIQKIAMAMASGDWRPYRSVREYAEKNNMSLASAEKYAGEATRLLRMSWGQDEAKVAVLERISFIGRDALSRREDAVTASGEVVSLAKPDHRTAFAAAKSLADYMGLGGTNAEVVIRYQSMTDSELWKETQKFAEKLTQGLQAHETSGIEVANTELADDDESAALHRLDAASTRPGR
jgi:hypothetical protein